jgi:uncharacterized protein
MSTRVKPRRSLDAVVEDAVNAVGVDLNTASAPLLARVSGLGRPIAEAIVTHRDANGPFGSRKDLLKVPGWATAPSNRRRVPAHPGGKEPLDASSVHPEAYGVAKKIVAACGRDLRTLMGDSRRLKKLDPQAFVDEPLRPADREGHSRRTGKPGRDPRPSLQDRDLCRGRR